MVFCRGCGKEIHESAPNCPHCGAPQKSATATTEIPDGVRGWSWGAFFLNWIWAIGNRTWIGLLALVPYLGFIMMIILGIKGREWAWKNKQWASLEEFNRVQRKWSAWGVGICVGTMVIGILAAVALPAYHDYTQRAKAARLTLEMQEQAQRVAQEEERARQQFSAEQQTRREAELAAQQTALAMLQAQQIPPTAVTQETPMQPVNPVQQVSLQADTQFTPSFDCQRASTGAERLICSNRELAAADVRMAQAYRDAYSRAPDRDLFRQEQTSWRRNVRDACSDAGCMLVAYNHRLQEFGYN